jgi:hypothetical protein
MPKNNRTIEPITDASFEDVSEAALYQSINNKKRSKNTDLLSVNGSEIHLLNKAGEAYISLTDIAFGFDAEGGSKHIDNWLRLKDTVEFLGVWERLNNMHFNSLEFEGIKKEAGLNRFNLSVKAWTQKTNGIGLVAKTGRYGSGTFAHKDIAFEFASWLSPEFKLYIIKEFERLKQVESLTTNQIEWNIRRTLAKAQYRVHTDAIKEHLIPPCITEAQIGIVYASEADLLNIALFGQTSKDWKVSHPMADGNQRDNATTEQLIVLSSLESQNALLIQQGKSKEERLQILNEQARRQMQSLLTNPTVQKLSQKPLLRSKPPELSELPNQS